MRRIVFGWLFFTNGLLSHAQKDSVVFQLFFVGGTGEPGAGIRDLIGRGTSRDVPTAVVFLGDNVYPKGLPEKESKDRRAGEEALLGQLSWAATLGDVYFIPGNRDWKNGQHEGLDYLFSQQKFFDSLKNHRVHFFPRDGCPGPEEIHLADDVLLVILDTQWFLHPWEKPEGQASHCDSKSAADVTIHLDDVLNRNQGKRIVVAGHHPVYTYGPHGGVFTVKDHLFPLTHLNDKLYLPLPIVGSLVPLHRKIFGGIQDVAHPLNKALRRGIHDVLKQYPGSIYVSGHELALEFAQRDSVSYVVSGSGSGVAPVEKKGYASFAAGEIGYSRLLIMHDGKARVDFFSAKGNIFHTELPKVKKPEEVETPLYEEDTLWVTTNASYKYESGKFRNKLLGENYRKEWAQQFQLQAFDIGREKGGLTILQKGGGMETMALRLRDSTGREYNLRSVEKYPVKALPPAFQKTFLQSVVQDQVSAAHPYGALVIPSLANAAKVFHTNPRVVYAPNDLRWGIYRKDFAGQVMLFEERPDGSGKDQHFFGDPVRMISTRKLLEHMAHDNDVQVDQGQVLRSRLFDMWIGDWDRSDDQWRWGEFDVKKQRIYKPIPRDRDQAFFVNEGFIPHQWRKKHIFPQLEGFDKTIRWAPGLMHEGRWFDRSFLNGLSRDQFQKDATALAALLTDAVIDSSLLSLPDEVYQLHGKVIAEKLKARRAILSANAGAYYDFLAKQVDVVGSNKREWFEIQWLANGNLDVKMFKRAKDGQPGRLLYHREFVKGETKEVRLYGLDGDDVFHLSGHGGQGAIVRLIGGGGHDEVSNSSYLGTIFLYDIKGGVTKSGTPMFDRTSGDPEVNRYDREDFEYNKIAPKNSIAYNIDDGVFVGTGFTTTAYGFRKKPYRSHHLLTGAYAIRTSSFNIRYEGRFPQLVGQWGLELDADIKSPNYVNNFFGWGNESVYDQSINQRPDITVSSSIDYYRLRFREMHAEVKLNRKIGQWGYVKGGPIFQRGEIVNPTEDRYIKEYDKSLPESILGVPKNFGGFTYTWGIDKRDNQNFPTRGIVFKQTSRFMDGFEGPAFSASSATFTLYQSFRLPATITYVFNAGGGHNTGSYQLYQAQALDGKTEIRGFRKTRFYGDTKLYFNNEVRVKLGSLRTYLFPAAIGIHGFYDVGRVWYKDENGKDPSAANGESRIWHHGFGGGLWLTPYNLATVVAEVGRSKEETLFYLRLGFLF